MRIKVSANRVQYKINHLFFIALQGKSLTLGKERNKRPPFYLAEVSALFFLSLHSLNRDFVEVQPNL